MPRFTRNHIIVRNRTETLPYTSPNTGRSKVIPRQIGDRQQHGSNIRQQFDRAVSDFNESYTETDYVYVVFKSPIDILLDLEKFDKGNFRLSSYRRIITDDAEGMQHEYYEAAVYLNRRAVSQFLRKINQYLNEDTRLTYNQDGSRKGGGNPKNQTLIANIEEVKAATLQSFWQEPELPFPNLDEEVWWEVWLTRDGNNDNQNPVSVINNVVENANIQIGQRVLKFPEHWVCLMKATANDLGAILYSDKLAEIRKPRETADFFTNLEVSEQANWISDLARRVDNMTSENNVSVCLLDTGVNRTHPLLIDLIPERNLDSVNPNWTAADTRTPFGHGTPMAGLILYGDLSEVFSNTHRVQIYHHLESVKLINDNAPHEPDLYGVVTQEAISRGEIIHPDFKRIVCLAVTAPDTIHRGRPTSWSAALDQTLFGSSDEPNNKLLVVVSSGNTALEERINYPISNEDSTIQDPAQSYNAITVGAYTLKDTIDLMQFPNSTPLANRGDMSPCNTTSMGWWHKWCKKPDIVMEGGNMALQNGSAIDPESLSLLSISRGGVGRSLLTSFSDTSASTALASKFAAELYTAYPSFQPETIRALIIHSADWTLQMLNNRNINRLNPQEKERLFSRVGYGVPNLDKAKYSANNSLSMIVERSLTPFRLDGSTIKTNKFHLFDLPWPEEVLFQLSETIVKFKITLSYFIEPNPGNKQYDLAASYMSHGLRFKMIGPRESLPRFKGRISKTLRENDYSTEASENWILGGQLRDKGSIHKDIWEGTAADLATRNKIAVYPVGGWWKTRKKLERYANPIKYSLVMTIETPSEDTDIYTPVENLISVDA
jgi:Subtilase family